AMHAFEYLDRALLPELLQAFLQLLRLERIARPRDAEKLRGEVRNSLEAQGLALGQRVANLQQPVIVDADDVAGDSILARHALVRHERHHVAELHLASDALMLHFHRRPIAPRANAKKRDAIAMLRIHIGLDLEHETGKRRFHWLHDTRSGVARLRRGRPLDQRLQDFLYAEIVDARAEEDRRLTPGQEFGEVERCAGVPDQIDVVPQRWDLVRKELVEPRIGNTLNPLAVLRISDALFAWGETQQAFLPQIEHAAKALAHADRPADRRTVDA